MADNANDYTNFIKQIFQKTVEYKVVRYNFFEKAFM